MILRVSVCVFLALAISISAVSPANAFWTVDGTALRDDTGYTEPVIISDGEGGAIIAWADYRPGTYSDIYVQRVDPQGMILWTEGGVAVCTAADYQLYPTVVSDGAGGAIITWQDRRNGSFYDIYAQKIDAGGAAAWKMDGIPICEAADQQLYPVIASNYDGGAIISWMDRRTGTATYDIYIQMVDSDGESAWPLDGIAVSKLAVDQGYPEIETDGAGGAIVAWLDMRDGIYWDIYAQRVDPDGNLKWTDDGVSICGASGNQYAPAICSDGSGGGIVTWWDTRAGGANYNIYAQRVDHDGKAVWTADGEPVCVEANNQKDPEITTDAAGGAIIAWIDSRSGYQHIYAQRMDTEGKPKWTAGGVAIATTTLNKDDCGIIDDGCGGAIITWYDNRNAAVTSSDIYAQRVNSLGTALWTADGFVVCEAVEAQIKPVITSDGDEGAIIAWLDFRTGDYGVYAQRITSDAVAGGSWPRIEEAADLPDDQGGWVRLRVARSDFDGLYEGSHMITGYNIWRRISVEALSAEAAVASGGVTAGGGPEAAEAFLIAPDDFFGLRLSGAAAAALNLPPGEWESLGFHAAMQEEYYDFAVPTRADSTGAGTAWETYVVTAHTTIPAIYFISDPDSGYSVDDLVPGAPTGFAAEQSFDPEGLTLEWNANPETDLWHYSVYRGESPDFIPSEGNRISTPTGVSFFDAEWRWDSEFCYKLSAVDRHGNESLFTLLEMDQITGGDTPAAPLASYLSQNYPNPFNPATSISFGLSKAGRVSICIYDAAGRLVRALVDEERGAGHYIETWDGRGADGAAMSSGVYFYRLTAGKERISRKMILLR